MKKYFITPSLFLITLFILSHCEHPSEFKRDNVDDPQGINFGIIIKNPKNNEIVNGIFDITIIAKDSSTQFNLKSIEVFIDDSLISNSAKIPFNVQSNTDKMKNGFHTIKFRIYTKDKRKNEETIQIFAGPQETQKKIFSENNTVIIEWDFGIKFPKYVINSSVSENMEYPDQIAIIDDPSITNFTSELSQISKLFYYQIIAINENGDSIKSNIQGIKKTLLNTAIVNEGINAVGVCTKDDGAIFLAAGKAGIKVYNYSDSKFIKIAESYLDGYASRVLVSKNNTIFVLLNAGQGVEEGLSAYTFNGTSITKVANVKNGLNALDLVEGPNDELYIANHYSGISAFSFDGLNFAFLAQSEDNSGSANGIAFSSEGTIFLANGYSGLIAYTFNGTTFTNNAKIEGYASDVKILPNGTIIVAKGVRGLSSYIYSGMKFSNTDNVDDGGSADRIAINADGTIFLANGADGVRAYVYDNLKLVNTAHINNIGKLKDIAIGKNNTIFIALDDNGLCAFEYKWMPL